MNRLKLLRSQTLLNAHSFIHIEIKKNRLPCDACVEFTQSPFRRSHFQQHVHPLCIAIAHVPEKARFSKGKLEKLFIRDCALDGKILCWVLILWTFQWKFGNNCKFRCSKCLQSVDLSRSEKIRVKTFAFITYKTFLRQHKKKLWAFLGHMKN